MNSRYRFFARGAAFCALLLVPQFADAQSLDIPSSKWGISFGNSKSFTGLRFNYRDSDVRYVNGINVTLWKPDTSNKNALIKGLSLGILPGGGDLKGIQIGVLGVAAEKKIAGLSVGLLGIGAGNDLSGISIGGLGLGSGGDVTGLNIGGLGIGAGGDLVGINLAGVGAGAGDNVIGLNIAGLGFGAGGDLTGITLAGLGAGAGRNATGVNIAGLGFGAGGRLAGITLAGFGVGAADGLYGITIAGMGAGATTIKGITIGGLGVGSGGEMCGITLAGLGAGAITMRGLTIAGLAVGGQELKGIQLALGTVRVVNDGKMSFFSGSAFNYIQGTQTGLSIGLVNFAYRLRGLQLGIINIVRDNPKYLRVLPLLNAPF